MCSPPREDNIFHLAWKNSQKKSRSNPISVNKVTLYESPINLNRMYGLELNNGNLYKLQDQTKKEVDSDQ